MTDYPDIDGDLYRKVLGRYPTGVVLVTTMDDDGPVAMVIGSFVSVSMDPPLVGFLPGKTSNTWARMDGAASFCVNVLADDQLDLCNAMFKHEDPWDTFEWRVGDAGAPVIGPALATIECVVHDKVDAGDHWFVMGRVVDVHSADDGSPLVFLGGKYGSFAPFD